MTDKDKALRLALEYVELVPDDRYNAEHIDQDALITAIKAALEAKDEPVVWNEGVPAMLPKQKEGETFIVSYEPKLEAKDEPMAWRDAAIRLGEELSSVGPDGYYDMDAKEWLDWAMEQNPRGKHSLPQRTWVGLSDEEIAEALGDEIDSVYMTDFRRVEAKLKEKNT